MLEIINLQDLMDYGEKFLSKYFLLLPNDIIIEIIKGLPPKAIEFFMNSNLFEPPVYDEFIGCIQILRCGDQNAYVSAKVNNTWILLDHISDNYSPRVVNIEGTTHDVSKYIIDNFDYFKLLNDIRLVLTVDLKDPPNITISKKLTQLSNLTSVTIKFYLLEDLQYISPTFSNCNDLQKFSQTLGKPQNLNHICENLPLSIYGLKFSKVFQLTKFNHFTNLKSLHINLESFTSLVTFPSTLEDVSFIRCNFYHDDARIPHWPAGLKTIHIEECSNISWKQNVSIYEWPVNLQKLIIIKSGLEKLPVGALPSCLVHLEINEMGGKRVVLSDSSNLQIEFPESLTTLKLENVILYNEGFVQFPPKLIHLTVSRSVFSLCYSIFPPTLEYLKLDSDGIIDLAIYENEKMNKDWYQLINLKQLILSNNSIGYNGIEGWLPPPNVQYLDLSYNGIRQLSINLFKPIAKHYTKELEHIDISHCDIGSLSRDFYLPDNIKSIYVKCQCADFNNLQKKIDNLIYSQRKANLRV
ncbi:hypothetical protein DFJ63DRAFT_310994 [Scheffersomyces coipomensis]|uniref:uncharacterized protein n=1 Tax=Scheffersomyces coipomensis TaxID=1788519 RepID=UPI00315D2AF6